LVSCDGRRFVNAQTWQVASIHASLMADRSAALIKLRTMVGITILALFWRRLRHQSLPRLMRSLSERWTARSLADVLATLPSLSPGAASPRDSPTAGVEVSDASSTSPPPLSETWSPKHLTRYLKGFRRILPLLPPPAPRFISWCDFQEDSLHDPDWGYYTDGRVVFGECADTADFTTFPVSMRPAFGAMLADRLCSLWRAMGAPTDAPFLIVELGAGTGVLAHDILEHCEAQLPALFWDVLCYVIGERSGSLRVVQAKTNQHFVDAGRLYVVPADAQDLAGCALRQTLQAVARQRAAAAGRTSAEPPMLRGAVISNELPDAFGVEKVLVSARGPSAAPPAPPTATPAAAASASVAAPSGGFGAAAQRLRLQRAYVLPLIRLDALRSLVEASDEALATALDLESLVVSSRAHRSALLAGERSGLWEVGYASEQLLPAAAAALDEWLHQPPPPPPPPSPPPPRVPSDSLGAVLGTESPLLARTWSSLSAVLPSVRARASPALPLGWLSITGDTAAAPSEWLHLSRDAYRALKGRCCRANTAPVPESLLATQPDAADGYGSPLEAALDRAVRIAEAFEVVSLDEPASRAEGCMASDDVGTAASFSNATAALDRWLRAHTPLLLSALRHRPDGERMELYPSPALPRLAQGLATLLDEAAVLTIDYGADAATLINAARRVPPAVAPADAAKGRSAAAAALAAAAAARSASGMRVRSRLPAARGQGAALALRRPGWCDLTTDVDFTELSAAGEAAGLRTIFFGPQTALQRVRAETAAEEEATGKEATGIAKAALPPPRVTDAQPPLQKGVCEAFYALGSFVMLVQATPKVADAWRWRVAPQPLYAAGHPSLGQMAMVHTLRALGRLVLDHALQQQQLAAAEGAPPPSERELVRALADALVLTVPCFRPHWRKMVGAVLRLLAEEEEEYGHTDDGDARSAPVLPPLYREALQLVKLDRALMLHKQSIVR
jgi:SAM-dependent MidA family methyltransferase